MALSFAAVGLAAIIAYAVTQRTREIGVRIALGAQRGDVVGLMAKEGVGMTVAGLALGIPAAWAAAQSISSLLFGVSPHDEATFCDRGAAAPGRVARRGLSPRAQSDHGRAGRRAAQRMNDFSQIPESDFWDSGR